jgi:hypothetical protein
LSRRCAGFKRDGTRCSATVTGPSDYCWHHDEAHAAERKRLASRAGRGSGRGGPTGSGSGEIAGLKAQLQAIADGVLDGTLDRGRAAVAVQAYGALRATLELERRWRELGEVEERLRVLEERLQAVAPRSWEERSRDEEAAARRRKTGQGALPGLRVVGASLPADGSGLEVVEDGMGRRPSRESKSGTLVVVSPGPPL